MTVLFGFIGTIIGYTIGSMLAAFVFRMYEYIQIIKARDEHESSPVEIKNYDEIDLED